MIDFVKGNIFDTGCDAIVIPVNCYGVMGAGLAAKAKSHFGLRLERDLKAMGVVHGGVKFWPDQYMKHVVALATKDHWTQPSDFTTVHNALMALPSLLRTRPEINSCALPKVGCGLGGLKWKQVKASVNMMDLFACEAGLNYLFEVYE